MRYLPKPKKKEDFLRLPKLLLAAAVVFGLLMYEHRPLLRKERKSLAKNPLLSFPLIIKYPMTAK